MGTPEEGEEGLLMDIITGRDGDVDNWKEVMLIYGSALKQIGTKLEILNDEFQHVHSYIRLNILNPGLRPRRVSLRN